MATENILAQDEAALRLDCLKLLLQQLAAEIGVARDALMDNPDDESIGLITVCALERLGWIADRGALIAAADASRDRDDADRWFLGAPVRERLEAVK